MHLELLNKNHFKNLVFIKKTILTRFILYSFVACLFFYFMQTYSPLGINWTSYHYERVVNSLRNIFENSQLTLFGYTSWTDVNDVRNSLENNIGKIYIVPIISYIFPAILYKLFGNFEFLNYGSLLDYIFICFTGILISEIGILLISVRNNIDSIFYGTIIFSLFISSPWTYRMTLAPWYEVGFLGIYILSIYFFIKNKINLGLIFLFISLSIHYLWGFLIFSFLILTMFINIIYKNVFKNNAGYSYLPNGLQNRKGFIKYSLICISSVILHFIRVSGTRLIGVNALNSGALYRIGINNVNNIHHGGLLGSFQFLGGNRYSLCLNNNLDQLSGIENYIKIFNCSLSITTLVIFSLMSIVGLFLLLKNNSQTKWILQPILWTFLFFTFIFQQSFAAHLQGHSYLFGFLFSIGITYLFKYLSEFLRLSNISNKLILMPLVSGLIINSIRVCYLTGING